MVASDMYRTWSAAGPDVDEVDAYIDPNGNQPFAGLAGDTTANLHRSGISATYDFTDKFNLFGGIERTEYKFFNHIKDFEISNARTFSYHRSAAYLQGMWDTDFAMVTTGARFETDPYNTSTLVPRIALTKALERFHWKLLAARAYRSPSQGNINTNKDLRPEYTNTYEMEGGYQLSQDLYLTTNVFDTTIYNPIVYALVVEEQSYHNFPRTSSRGFEVETRWVRPQGYVALSYSYYIAAEKNEVDIYNVPDDRGALLGIPQNKIALNSHYRLVKNLFVNPSVIYLGKRYGYDVKNPPDTENGETDLRTFAPTKLVNVYFDWKNFGIENLNAGIGFYNILNEDYQFIEPYRAADGAHTPIPGLSREVVIDLGYRAYF